MSQLKKVILGQITPEESKNIQAKERNYYTFVTLSNNQFIKEEERDDLVKRINETRKDIQMLYDVMVEKYNLPFLDNLSYNVSIETNEVYILIP